MKKILLIILILNIKLVFLQSCGRTLYSSGLIVGGDEVKRGEFPFLIALLRFVDQKFFCSANLITNKHGLTSMTASHCIHGKTRTSKLQPEDFFAQLGKHDLKLFHETGVITKEISEIHLHEDWKSYTERYDADIALLTFESEVEFSKYIQVVCLPTSWQSNDLIEGDVVGFGYSERTHYEAVEDTPRKIRIKKPFSNEFCFLHNHYVATISSNRTFCAGGENSGPCFGDSGGGFYVKRKSIWYLQGIVSSSLINSQRQCDVSTYAVYTNVALFIDWINEKVKEKGGIEGNSKTIDLIATLKGIYTHMGKTFIPQQSSESVHQKCFFETLNLPNYDKIPAKNIVDLGEFGSESLRNNKIFNLFILTAVACQTRLKATEFDETIELWRKETNQGMLECWKLQLQNIDPESEFLVGFSSIKNDFECSEILKNFQHFVNIEISEEEYQKFQIKSCNLAEYNYQKETKRIFLNLIVFANEDRSDEANKKINKIYNDLIIKRSEIAAGCMLKDVLFS